jgi:DNA-binding MarR family transcriptional regulator
MENRPVPPGGAKETGEAVGRELVDEGWRAALHRHAAALWRGDAADPAFAEALSNTLGSALGPLADDALTIVDAYARGARRASGETVPPAEFGTRLDLVLNGIEASLAPAGPSSSTAAGKPHMIQSELWQVLRKVRESAELSYSREQYLIELDRRILFLLQDRGPQVPADISSAVGVDKAQVSRSVKRLLEMRLLEREQIRAPLRLTRDGERIGRRLMRRAELRNRELTLDISDAELSDFYDTIELLLARAVALYEQERELAQDPAGARNGDAPGKELDGKPGEKVAIDRSRIVSPLLTLSAYFSRSGSLAFKRLTGLSSFEAFVLSEIGIDPPTDWATLVKTLARDHSQAGRTVTALMERGLVEREGKPGRRHGRFFPTKEGARLFEVIHEAGRQRSNFLLAPLGAEQRARFLATFEKVRRNATAQLERERAFAEIDRP